MKKTVLFLKRPEFIQNLSTFLMVQPPPLLALYKIHQIINFKLNKKELYKMMNRKISKKQTMIINHYLHCNQNANHYHQSRKDFRFHLQSKDHMWNQFYNTLKEHCSGSFQITKNIFLWRLLKH